MSGQSELLQPISRCGAAFGLRHVEHFEAERDIVKSGAPGQKPVVLEDDRDFSTERVELDERISSGLCSLCAIFCIKRNRSRFYR